MVRFYQKNPLAFSLIWIAGYVVAFSVCDSISQSLGMSKIITAPVGVIMAAFLFLFLKGHGLLEEYGLCPFQGDKKAFLYFLPLVVLCSTNLWNGLQWNASLPETSLFIVSMLCVGFLEEVIFRGLLLQALARDNLKTAVIVSSLTFGIGHIVNLLNGAALLPTLLQICYACALGFLFCMIFLRGKSLLPCILAHSVVNSLSIFAVPGSQAPAMVTTLVIWLASIGYAVYILRHTQPKKAAEA